MQKSPQCYKYKVLFKAYSSVDPYFVVLNDFYTPYVSVKVSATATSRSRLSLGPLRLGSRLDLGLKGLMHITAH